MKDDNKVINEKPVIKVEKEEVFVEKIRKLRLEKEAKVTITDKEDGDLTDQAEVKDFDIKQSGNKKRK